MLTDEGLRKLTNVYCVLSCGPNRRNEPWKTFEEDYILTWGPVLKPV
jgi:hypothetical protein